MTYVQAEAYCFHGNAKVAEPKNHAQNNAVSNLSNEPLWIGVNDIGHEGYFTYASNGAKMTYANWGLGQPDNFEGNQDRVCVNWVREL